MHAVRNTEREREREREIKTEKKKREKDKERDTICYVDPCIYSCDHDVTFTFRALMPWRFRTFHSHASNMSGILMRQWSLGKKIQKAQFQ